MHTNRGTAGGDNQIKRAIAHTLRISYTSYAGKHRARLVTCNAKRHGNGTAGSDKGSKKGGVRGNDLAGAGGLTRADQLIPGGQNANTGARMKSGLCMAGRQRQRQRARRERRAGGQYLRPSFDIKPGRPDEAAGDRGLGKGDACAILFGAGDDIFLQDDRIGPIGHHRTGENAHRLAAAKPARPGMAGGGFATAGEGDLPVFAVVGRYEGMAIGGIDRIAIHRRDIPFGEGQARGQGRSQNAAMRALQRQLFTGGARQALKNAGQRLINRKQRRH